MTTTAPPRTGRPPDDVDLEQVMIDTQTAAIAREGMYEALVCGGHRRPDPKEERIIRSLYTAASLVEQEYYRRRGR